MSKLNVLLKRAFLTGILASIFSFCTSSVVSAQVSVTIVGFSGHLQDESLYDGGWIYTNSNSACPTTNPCVVGLGGQILGTARISYPNAFFGCGTVSPTQIIVTDSCSGKTVGDQLILNYANPIVLPGQITRYSFTSGNGTYGYGAIKSLVSPQLNIPISNDGGVEFETFTCTPETKLEYCPSGPLSITTKTLPNATSGQSYSQQLYGAGGSGLGYVWSLVSGALPEGFTMTPKGAVTSSGSPAAEPRSYSFTVQLRDSDGGMAMQAFELLINPPDCSITSETLETVPRIDSKVRKTIGVGEVVHLTNATNASWSTDGNGILSYPDGGTCSLDTSKASVRGKEACFTAPFEEGQDTITAEVGSQSCSITLNTIEPSGLIYQKLTKPGYEFKDPQHPVRIGFWAALFVLPGTVSFANIGIAEEDVNPPELRKTTQVKNLFFTIPAQGIFPNPTFQPINASFVGCDLDTVDWRLAPLPLHKVFSVVYTWGSPNYINAQKKQFATVETDVTFPLFFSSFQKGQVQSIIPAKYTFVEPYATLLLSDLSKPSSIPPTLEGACIADVESQFSLVSMSQ